MRPAAERSPSPAPAALDGMSKQELLAHAAAQGVEGVSSRMTKADIRRAIEGA